MSSVLHPVGPEAPQTYWLRRAAVVVAALVVLAVIIWAVWPRSTRTAAPATGPTPGGSVTPVSSPSGSPAPTASPTGSGRPSASPSASTGGSATPVPPTPPPSAISACDPEQVRVTLTGPGKVKADDTTTFELSVINGSAATCTVGLTPSTFELKVYSGTDRIWSTDDCAKWLAAKADHRLAPEKAYEWTIDWAGKRSKTGCDLAGGLKAGTYVATAQFGVGSASSTPVQVVMRLR